MGVNNTVSSFIKKLGCDEKNIDILTKIVQQLAFGLKCETLETQRRTWTIDEETSYFTVICKFQGLVRFYEKDFESIRSADALEKKIEDIWVEPNGNSGISVCISVKKVIVTDSNSFKRHKGEKENGN